MDWNSNLRNLVSSRPAGPDTSFNFLYNYGYDQYPVMEMKQPGVQGEEYSGIGQDRKKRLTNEQLELLERSFQEEIKLDPDRKMKLSLDLGIQPRQIAVWFQNRRARWKAKQLERLYDALTQEFEAVTKEKQKLQEEVMKLKAMLRDEAGKKPMSTGYTDASGEETVESTSVVLWGSGSGREPPPSRGGSNHNPIVECNYFLAPGTEEYTPVPSPYWSLSGLPSYPS